MNFKHTSQLAMLSVLLTFNHAIGQTSGAQAAAPTETAAPSEAVSQEEEGFAMESQRAKRQRRLAKYQEQRLKRQQEAAQNDDAPVAPQRQAAKITFKIGPSESEREARAKKKQSSKRKEQLSPEEIAASVREGLAQGKLATIVMKPTRQSKPVARWNPFSFFRRGEGQEQKAEVAAQVAAERPEVVRVVNRLDLNRTDGEEGSIPSTLSTVLLSPASQAIVLSGQGSGDYEKVKAQVEGEARVQERARRKSWPLSESFSFNSKKVAEKKAERRSRSKKRDNAAPAARKRTSADEAAARKPRGSEVDNNLESYTQANQYQCDSAGADWPCRDCVVRRRANIGISVCTMIVTVVAIIVGAVIIAHASDSPQDNKPVTPTPTP